MDIRVDTARQSAATIEAKLVRVVVREPALPISGLVIEVDGASQGTRPWVLAVTPGRLHKLSAIAPDGRRWQTDVAGSAGDVVHFDIAYERSESAQTDTPRDVGRPSPIRTIGLVVGAVGLGALATGGVFGLLASLSRSDLANAVNSDSQCTGTYPQSRCDPGAAERLQPIEDRAHTQSTVSTIAIIAGSVLFVGGGLMYLLAPSRISAKTARSDGRGLELSF
jgi:hypothetical protein